MLTVSTIASLAAKWPGRCVAAFQDANPGLEVRITTSAHLVDFRREEVDMAVRYGRGNWPGLRTRWLMAEDMFPVCPPGRCYAPENRCASLPTWRITPCCTPRNRARTGSRLTAAGLPTAIAARRGLSFDQGR